MSCIKDMIHRVLYPIDLSYEFYDFSLTPYDFKKSWKEYVKAFGNW